MEAAHKASLAKGEVGIREKKPVPTLEKFLENDFLPFVRTTKAAKPNTVRFYENSVANLQAYSKLAGLHLDQITTEHLDWGACLVGKETKWRPAAATASPLFPTILHFVS